jgi:hypothetical protein
MRFSVKENPEYTNHSYCTNNPLEKAMYIFIHLYKHKANFVFMFESDSSTKNYL